MGSFARNAIIASKNNMDGVLIKNICSKYATPFIPESTINPKRGKDPLIVYRAIAFAALTRSI